MFLCILFSLENSSWTKALSSGDDIGVDRPLVTGDALVEDPFCLNDFVRLESM